MTFLTLTVFVWFVLLLKRGAFMPGLPATYRLSLITLSIFLLWNACYSVQLVIWGVFHPILFFDRFHIRLGIFPPVGSFGIALLCSVAGCVEYYIGFRLAEQKRAAYLLGVRAAPYLFLATVFSLSLRHPDLLDWTRRGYLLFGIVSLPIGAFYFWLYRFFTNSRNQKLLNRSAETATPRS